MKHYYLNFYRLLLLLLVIASPDLLYAQSRTVSGRVLEDGTTTGIPGANVRIKGTSTGTVTDLDGAYQITASEGDVLVFSFVGYLPEEVTVGNQSQIDVSLVQDIQTLEELVVVGYGTQERARVTSAISSVSAEEINQQPVTSVDQALQGRASGVTVANTGSPGANPLVRIRGLGSVGNNDPLYVIDGMPARGLNEINPNDIESIQILKDASAAAIYGSRASNGVVVVTTKKGSKNKAQINLDAYYGVQNAWKQLDLLNRDQYIQYANMLQGDNLPPRFSRMDEEIYPNAGVNWEDVDTDWQDEMFRTAPIQDYNISITGGGDNSLFNVGGGYFKQEGIMLGTGFERYSFRANSEFNIGRLKVGETLTIARTSRQNEPFNGGRSQIEHMIKMVPYIPVEDPTREGGYRGTDDIDLTDPENPVLNAMLRQNWDENTKLLGTAYATYEILDGLEYKLLFGLDMNFGFNERFTPLINPSNLYHINASADFDHTRREFVSPLISNQLSYSKDFGDHHIDAVAVVEQQTSISESTRAIGETSLTSKIDVLDIATDNVDIAGNRFEYVLQSYLARVNYDYAGKYLLGASVRRDGGSRFGTEKWGTFPAVSAGWRISEEAFLENNSVVSDIKLRASWGQVGNDQIGDYRWQSTVSSNYPYILGEGQAVVNGFAITDMTNPNIKWEITTMTNIGLDLGFLNDKIRASAEIFINKTEDLLLPVPIPNSYGYERGPTANVGALENTGFEFMAGYFKSGGEFEWSLNGNISFVKNELTSLGLANAIPGSNFEGTPTTFTEEGEPIGYFRGFIADGLFQNQSEIDELNNLTPAGTYYQDDNTSPGDIRFRDISGPEGIPDGIISDYDRTNIGHFLPDFTYGLNGTANFKNFDLSVFFQGVSGNEILNTNIYDLQGMLRLFNAGTEVLDAWTPSNTDTDIPRAVIGDPNNNARLSTRYIEDGSYLRLKNLTIGYSIPSALLRNLGNGFIRNVRFYVTSQNLLTFTNYSGYDPEIGARPDLFDESLGNDPMDVTINSGVDWGQFPQARTFLGGIQIGF